MKPPLEIYNGDPDAVVGSWVLLERITAKKVEGGEAAATLGVSRAGRVHEPPECDPHGPRKLRDFSVFMYILC